MKDHQQRDFYNGFWTVGAQGTPDPHILDGDSRKGLCILSLGCAMGEDVWHLTQDHRVCGIELSKSGASVARDHDIDAQVGSVTDPFPYPDQHFDIVVAKDILEHVLDPLCVMREIRRVLRPDGELVLQIPNQFYWWFRLRYLFGRGLIWKTFMHDQTQTFEEWNYIHVRFFTWKGVRRFLDASEFKIVETYFDFGCLEHYFQPDVYARMYRQRWRTGEPKSRRGLLVCYGLYPLWRCLNLVLPKTWRRRVVALAPGLLTASFYLRCRVSATIERP